MPNCKTCGASTSLRAVVPGSSQLAQKVRQSGICATCLHFLPPPSGDYCAGQSGRPLLDSLAGSQKGESRASSGIWPFFRREGEKIVQALPQTYEASARYHRFGVERALGMPSARERLREDLIRAISEDFMTDRWTINDLSRQAVMEMAATNGGEVWIGRINFYSEHPEGCPAITRWEGEPIYNFAAAFALPRFDDELETRIQERRMNPKVFASDGPGEQIAAIIERIEQRGGLLLHWV